MDDLASLFSSSFTRAPWGWGLFGMVLLGLIRVWPLLSKLAIEAKAKQRQEKREDLADCHTRLDAIQREFNGLKSSFNDLKINLNDALLAYRILDVEVEEIKPTSSALKQARAIMSTSFAVSPSTPLRKERES